LDIFATKFLEQLSGVLQLKQLYMCENTVN